MKMIRSGSRLIALLVLLSLALGACSPSQATPAPAANSEKSGYPAATGPTAYPAQGNPTGYPAPQPQGASAPTSPALAGYPAPQSGQPLQIVKPDGSTVTLAAADLQKLSSVVVTVGHADMSGYKLSDVLAAAGVTSFQQVTVTGTGAPVTLTQAQVTPDVILSTVDPSGLQLAGSNLSADQMVKGVAKIEVK